MSTKIYDGMIAVDKNPFTVQRKIKETVEPLFHQRFKNALRLALANRDKTWTELFDLPIFGFAEWEKLIGEEDVYEIGDKLYDLIVALMGTATHTFSELDFGYEVVLIPNGNGIRLAPLVLLFAEKSGDQYRQALFNEKVTREYGYWNNTDQPDELTEDQWDERMVAWDKLEVPGEDGLIIQMPSKFATSFMARAELRQEERVSETKED